MVDELVMLNRLQVIKELIEQDEKKSLTIDYVDYIINELEQKIETFELEMAE